MTSPSFDIRVGMIVHGADGRSIGTVTEVAGFGATRIAEVSGTAPDSQVTEASSGTGYMRVDQKLSAGSDAADLYVPFHGIEDVSPEKGITLNESAFVTHFADHPIEKESRPWWQTWLPRKQSP